MESRPFPGFSYTLTLQILLLLGSTFEGVGNDIESIVEVHHKFVDTLRFNCSTQEAFSNHSKQAFRMLQIKHFSETNKSTVWAVIDSGGVPTVPDTQLKTLGDRSISVTGRINEANVSWLQLALFDSELDVSMRNYGTFACFVWHKELKEPWTSNRVYYDQRAKFPVHVDGFRVLKDNAVDLTCRVQMPSQTGSQDTRQTITMRADHRILASWRSGNNQECSDNALCSPVRHVRGVDLYVKVRLLQPVEGGAKYRCHFQTKEVYNSSEEVQIPPPSQSCFSSEDCVLIDLEVVACLIIVLFFVAYARRICLARAKCIRNRSNRKVRPLLEES